MARQIRKKSGTGIYHVMLRGINRQDGSEGHGSEGQTWDHGVGSTDHLSRQTMRIKTVMNHNQENDQKNRPHDFTLIKNMEEGIKITIVINLKIFLI